MRIRQVFRHILTLLVAEWLKSLLVTLVLIVGMSATVLTVSHVHAVRDGLQSFFARFGSRSCILVSYGGLAGRERGKLITEKDIAFLNEQLQGMAQFSGRIVVPSVSVGAGTNKVTVQISAVGPPYLLDERLEQYFSPQDTASMARVCVLDDGVAKVLMPSGSMAGKTVDLCGAPFLVKGVVSRSGYWWPQPTIWIPLTTGMRRVRNTGDISKTDVKVAVDAEVSSTVERIRGLMRQRHQLKLNQRDDFFIITPKTITGANEEASAGIHLLGAIVSILATVLGTGMLGLLAALDVKQNAKLIGVKRAFGATQGEVAFEYFLRSAALSAGAFVATLFLTATMLWALRHFSGGSPPMAFMRLSPLSALAAAAIAIAVAVITGTLGRCRPNGSALQNASGSEHLSPKMGWARHGLTEQRGLIPWVPTRAPGIPKVAILV